MDELVASLERGLGPLLTRGRPADDRATEARIREAARGSIAQRLRESGAEPPPD